MGGKDPSDGKKEKAGDAPGAEDEDYEKLLRAGNVDAMIPGDLSGKDRVVHADDAMDFESEDELAEEEESDEGAGAANGGAAGSGNQGDDEEDWTKSFAKDLGLFEEEDAGESAGADPAREIEAMQRAEEARRRFEEEERQLALDQLKEWYPGFEPHTVLRMNKLFGPEPSKTQLPQPKTTKPVQLNRIRLEVDPDEAAVFTHDSDSQIWNLAKRARSKCLTREITDESVSKLELELGRKSSIRPNKRSEEHSEEAQDGSASRNALNMLQFEVSNWDEVLEAGSSPSSASSSPSPKSPSPSKEGSNIRISDIRIDEEDIYGSDEEQAILEGAFKNKRTKLDLNDSHLTFVEDRRSDIARGKRGGDEPQLNVSNDAAYDMLRGNYQRKVRSTIGSLNIDHAMAALRLQSPFYKGNYTKSQLRSWHRQKFGIKPGTVVQLTNVKSRKRWKDKNRVAQEVFSKSSDLTLGDNAPIFLIEYSEETPLVLSGFGMGSKLINYYRKKSPNDTTRPKRPLGETHVLEEQDRSTFWNFGFVEPGNIVPTLYNQMIRSPVFQHDPEATDFLFVKSTTRLRGAKYYLRRIPYIFVSGQVFPAVQIPGPHSRKVTAASKNRLKMVVYRVLNKDPNHRLQIKDISAHFPDHNEVQNRQRLKEFMEYQRSGPDQGFWKVKPGDVLPNETDIRNMITPEDIMLLESMRVGQQHLEDSGYSKSVEEDGNNDRDTEGLSMDEQLAPWNMSRNFINAIQGKAMLQLNGVGDPTARGEGFSFLRTSMKGGFATEVSAEDEKKLGGHSYNVALQQKAYDEEIRRIWYAQRRSLSIKDPKLLPDAYKTPESTESAAQTPYAGSSGKVLQITRVVRDENDVLVRQTELVTDPQVIRAYLRRRKVSEEEKMAVDQISVTDDAEANKQRRKFLEQELARLNRNADRRQARKATKQDPKLKATTRKCATCGAVGHIKTNKSCPMYNDIYLNAASSKK